NNDVTLVITDAAGRTETQSFNLVSGVNLLAAGLHQFAYNAGVASSYVNRDIHYDTGQPVLSAFHRYGVSDRLTLGANLQADNDQQMGGLEATFGGSWGIVRNDVAGSHAQDGGDGFALQSQYQYIENGKRMPDGSFKGARNFSAIATY